jgi:hypothetical protein
MTGNRRRKWALIAVAALLCFVIGRHLYLALKIGRDYHAMTKALGDDGLSASINPVTDVISLTLPAAPRATNAEPSLLEPVG